MPRFKRQLRADLPIVLEVAGEIGPLLADEADGIDAAVIDPTQQERRERITAAGGEIRIAGEARCLRSEGGAARNTLPAETVVVVALMHGAGFEGVLVLDPRQIVIEGVDGVLRSVVGLAAPGGVAFAEAEPQEVLIAIGNAREADFILPVDAALDCGLRRIVIFAPVVAAGIEVVEEGRTEGVVPAHAKDFAVALRVVVIGVEPGKHALAALRAGRHIGAIDAGITGEAVLFRENVVALSAEFVDGGEVGTLVDQIIRAHIPGRARSDRDVRDQGQTTALVGCQSLDGDGVKPAFRDLVAGKDVAREPRTAGGVRLGSGRVVDRNQCAGGVDPLGKIALVHLGGGNGGGGGGGAIAVAEPFVREEEEGLVLAVVDFGNPDGSAGGGAEVVLLVDGLLLVERVGEEAVGVEGVVAEEFVHIAVQFVGAALGCEAHHAAARVAVFGLESVGFDGEFGNRLDRGRVHGDPGGGECARGIGRNAIQVGAVTGRLSSAQREVVIAEILGFRREGGQRKRTPKRAAYHHRQLID